MFLLVILPQSVYKLLIFFAFTMKFVNKNTIQLDKTLTVLDLFVLDFIRILERYTEYVIVSGYISILFGRSRSTEDIDIFIRKIDLSTFTTFYTILQQHGYWCLNAEHSRDAYQYLAEGLAVRFARKDETIPNFEVKFALTPLSQESFCDRLLVKTQQGEIYISSLERQIAFKRYYLKSEKDLEDARHLEEVFKDQIDIKRIEIYKNMIEHEES